MTRIETSVCFVIYMLYSLEVNLNCDPVKLIVTIKATGNDKN